MAGMFGHTWVSQYGANPEGIGADTWAAALGGITPQQLGQGLRAALATGADWPPSAPRFRAMCLGIPSLASVSLIVAGKAQPTPFSRLVWDRLDSYRLRTCEQSKADRLISDAYTVASDYVMQGGELPAEPVAMIEKPAPKESKPCSPEVAAEHMAKLAAMFHVEPDAEVEA
jgi:hypothetical protein